MKYLIGLLIIIAAIFAFMAFKPNKKRSDQPILNKNQTNNSNMILTSPEFEHNGNIPPKFTCDGGNHNPQLNIDNVPSGAKSLALIVDDPDAPIGTFTHWLIWNISPETKTINEESVPAGAVEGKNGSSKIGYTGPCPPDKKPHRYFFKLYALDDVLGLAPGAAKRELESAIKEHILERAELIGIYER